MFTFQYLTRLLHPVEFKHGIFLRSKTVLYILLYRSMESLIAVCSIYNSLLGIFLLFQYTPVNKCHLYENNKILRHCMQFYNIAFQFVYNRLLEILRVRGYNLFQLDHSMITPLLNHIRIPCSLLVTNKQIIINQSMR